MQSNFAGQQVAVEWSGVRSIDVGMENLFFILRQLADPEVECRRHSFLCPRDQCGKIDAVTRYLERMFQREEEQMRERGYPGHERHALAHRDLLARVHELRTARTCGRLEQTALADRVRQWAAEHMASEDRPLGLWMRESHTA